MWIESYDNPDFAKGIVSTMWSNSDIHWHPRHELFYMIKGTTNYMIGGKRYALHAGQMVFIPAGVMHNMDNQEGIYNERLMLSISDDLISAEYQPYIEHLTYNNLIYIPPKCMYEIDQIFKTIEAEYKNTRNHHEQIITLCILQLLTLIDRYKCKPPKTTLDKKDILINNVAKHIRQNYSKPLGLDSLSSIFSINKNYLSRRFKTVFGIGINDYITYIRLLNAEKLLKESDYPITQIAAECGYNDSNYFSTAFKKFKGISPNKFKKEYSRR